MNDRRVLHFEDLRNALMEFGVVVRRPPFLEDQTQNKYTVQMPQVMMTGGQASQNEKSDEKKAADENTKKAQEDEQ
jgi:hypothetical protein